MATYVVTSAALVAKVAASQGGERYFYRGDVLSGVVSQTEIDRLVDIGLVGTTGDAPAPTKK